MLFFKTMALKVKSIADAANKLVDRASVAGDDYKKGVQETNDWEEKALASKEAYEQGVADAISRNARGKGIERAGNEKWKEKAVELGVSRFPQGVRAGKSDYQSATAPYFETLRGLTLSPRGPKGSPQNYERSKAVGSALHNQKIGA